MYVVVEMAAHRERARLQHCCFNDKTNIEAAGQTPMYLRKCPSDKVFNHRIIVHFIHHVL